MTDPAAPRTRRLRPATIAAHAGLAADPSTGAVGPSIVPSTIFRHGNPGGFEYGREHNPTWLRLEEALTELEAGAGAVVFSSGMAAVSACIEQVHAGARVVAPHNAYSGTRALLHELGALERVVPILVDVTDTAAVRTACQGAALLCLETLTNPLLTVPDLRACIDAAHDSGALVMVDNTFATPLTVRPLTLGADLVVHSLTKYVGGHSDLLMGAVVTREERRAEQVRLHRTNAGAIPGQLEVWLALRGLRTLDVRLRRQMQSAAELAQRLAAHPSVVRVHYPGLPSHPQHDVAARQMELGFGGMVSVEVGDGAEDAEALCGAVRLWQHTTSLGGVESTLERRSRYPLDSGIVPESLVRLSVGVEDVEDLWDDLAAALAVVGSGTTPG